MIVGRDGSMFLMRHRIMKSIDSSSRIYSRRDRDRVRIHQIIFCDYVLVTEMHEDMALGKGACIPLLFLSV